MHVRESVGQDSDRLDRCRRLGSDLHFLAGVALPVQLADISSHTSPHKTGCHQVSGGSDAWVGQGVNGLKHLCPPEEGYQQPLSTARGVTTDGEMADRHIFQE